MLDGDHDLRREMLLQLPWGSHNPGLQFRGGGGPTVPFQGCSSGGEGFRGIPKFTSGALVISNVFMF